MMQIKENISLMFSNSATETSLHDFPSFSDTLNILYLLYLAHSTLGVFNSIKLHLNKRTLKTKHAFREQLSWLCLLSEVKSDAILGTTNRLGTFKCNDKFKL